MGNTATVHGSGKTGMQAKGIKASYVSGTRLYFHADSETFLAVDGDELEQESNALCLHPCFATAMNGCCIPHEGNSCYLCSD